MYLKNNTSSRRPTHFLRGVELVEAGRNEFNIASENYTSPYLSFGQYGDPYYAEIWTDGMDWQNTYWLIEQTHHEMARMAIPAAIFPDHHPRLSTCDLDELLRGMMWYRRDEVWIGSGDMGAYSDSVWPFLTDVEETSNSSLVKVRFKSAAWDATFEMSRCCRRPRPQRVPGASDVNYAERPVSR